MSDFFQVYKYYSTLDKRLKTVSQYLVSSSTSAQCTSLDFLSDHCSLGNTVLIFCLFDLVELALVELAANFPRCDEQYLELNCICFMDSNLENLKHIFLQKHVYRFQSFNGFTYYFQPYFVFLIVMYF